MSGEWSDEGVTRAHWQTARWPALKAVVQGHVKWVFDKSIVDAGGPLAYGEQCADTDGLAAIGGTRLATDEEVNTLCRHLMDDVRELRAECAKLVERCVRAEVNATKAERRAAAAELELAQRKALPLNALRHGGVR